MIGQVISVGKVWDMMSIALIVSSSEQIITHIQCIDCTNMVEYDWLEIL